MRLELKGHLVLCLGLIAFGCLYQEWGQRWIHPADLLFPLYAVFPQVVLGMSLLLTYSPNIATDEKARNRIYVTTCLIGCVGVMIGSLMLHVYAPVRWLAKYPVFVWSGVDGNPDTQYLLHGAIAPALGGILTGVLIAPILEELFYRRRIYRLLAQRFGHYRAMAVSTLLFVALHANLGYTWSGYAQIALWAVLFTEVYKRSGSIFLTMVVHATVNFVISCAVIGYYRLNTG